MGWNAQAESELCNAPAFPNLKSELLIKKNSASSLISLRIFSTTIFRKPTRSLALMIKLEHLNNSWRKWNFFRPFSNSQHFWQGTFFRLALSLCRTSIIDPLWSVSDTLSSWCVIWDILPGVVNGQENQTDLVVLKNQFLLGAFIVACVSHALACFARI